MDEKLKKYLRELNCIIINPVNKSLHSPEIVGWYCKSSSLLRKPQHLKSISTFIQERNLEYHVSEINEATSEFLIHKN